LSAQNGGWPWGRLKREPVSTVCRATADLHSAVFKHRLDTLAYRSARMCTRGHHFPTRRGGGQVPLRVARALQALFAQGLETGLCRGRLYRGDQHITACLQRGVRRQTCGVDRMSPWATAVWRSPLAHGHSVVRPAGSFGEGATKCRRIVGADRYVLWARRWDLRPSSSRRRIQPQERERQSGPKAGQGR
jgi:hypothetical protein